MKILTIRTDKPESELGLFENDRQIGYITWEAHRALAETLSLRIKSILSDHNLDIEKIDGIVVYKGPGSFTGLRIGISVANSLAYGLKIPIIGQYSEDDWITKGINRLILGENSKIIVPEYGAGAHITQPKK